MIKLAARIDGPVAVIGDVHGQVDKLIAVLEALRARPDFDRRWLVFIGDLVDRGPDPKGAMEIVADLLLEHRRTTVVAGNHDLAMAAALGLVPTPDYSDWGSRWIRHYDSETTFASYGASVGDLQDLRARMPDRHAELLAAMPWCVEHPHLLFVHAGLDPSAPFEMQLRILRARDFTLNRPTWLCSKTLVDADPPADCPVTVVSGHVRVPQVIIRKRRILVDTTGGIDGDLSCLLLPERELISSGRAAAVLQERPAAGTSLWNRWRGG